MVLQSREVRVCVAPAIVQWAHYVVNASLTLNNNMTGLSCYSVVLGAPNLVKRGTEGSLIVPVIGQTIHKEYDHGTIANDIAILTLSYSVNFTGNQKQNSQPVVHLVRTSTIMRMVMSSSQD